jgi:hypothetical protein
MSGTLAFVTESLDPAREDGGKCATRCAVVADSRSPKSLRLQLGGAESSKRSSVRMGRNLCGGVRSVRCPELVTCETICATVAAVRNAMRE